MYWGGNAAASIYGSVGVAHVNVAGACFPEGGGYGDESGSVGVGIDWLGLERILCPVYCQRSG